MTRRYHSDYRLFRLAPLAITATLAAALLSPALAQTAKPVPADAASTPAYQAAMGTMMTDMMIPYSGNADVDFIRGMIPHHQGAVDNARIVLKYGKDPEVLKFAQNVIDAQEAEIKWMTEWLAKNGG